MVSSAPSLPPDGQHPAAPHQHRRHRLRRSVAFVAAAATAAAGGLFAVAPHPAAAAVGAAHRAGARGGLGQTAGLLPRSHLTEESALQVDLSRDTVRLPLYKGRAHGRTVSYVLLDASDQGLAAELGVNFAPKLANVGIGCATCIEDVRLAKPTPTQNHFGAAVVDFQDAPDFSPTRVAVPGRPASR